MAALNAVACAALLVALLSCPRVSLTPADYHSGHGHLLRDVAGHAEVCDPAHIPTQNIVCYVKPGDPHFDLASLDPCLCTHVVYGTLEVQRDLSLGPFLHENLTALALLHDRNPHLVPMVELRGLDHIMLVPTDDQLRTLSHQVWTTIQPTHPGGLDINYQFHGIDYQVAMEQRRVLANTLQHLREEIPLKAPVLTTTVAKEPYMLKHAYDFPAITKAADYINLPAFMFHDNPQYAVHPAPLHGERGAMDNTDSLVNLVLSMGVPPQKIVVGVPMFGVTYRLADADTYSGALGAPLDVHGRERSYVFNHPEFCVLQHNLNFSVLRDQDLTAPYAVSGDAFLGFEDEMSLRLKGKYVHVRDLGGVYAYPVNADDAHAVCGEGTFPLLHSLHEGIAGIASSGSIEYLETDDDARIVRIVDQLGNELHVDGLNSYSVAGFTCSRQGFYRHPADCSQFYRCVKFDQRVPDYTVYMFDCPAGLVFDDRIEVCNWPSWSQPCPGSGEISSTPKTTFRCPGVGYYQDPENCRWFYFCDDVYENGTLTPFDMRCPYGLGFDATTFTCNYRSITPGCSDHSGVVQQALFGPSLYAPGEFYHRQVGADGQVIVPHGGIPVAHHQHRSAQRPQPVGLHGVPTNEGGANLIATASQVSGFQVASPLSVSNPGVSPRGPVHVTQLVSHAQPALHTQAVVQRPIIHVQEAQPQAHVPTVQTLPAVHLHRGHIQHSHIQQAVTIPSGPQHDLHVHETHIQTPTQAQYHIRSHLVPSEQRTQPVVQVQGGHAVQVQGQVVQPQLISQAVQQEYTPPRVYLQARAPVPHIEIRLDAIQQDAVRAVPTLYAQRIVPTVIGSPGHQQVQYIVEPIQRQQVGFQPNPGVYAAYPAVQGFVRPQASRQVVAHQPQTFLYRDQDYNNHMRYSPGMSLYGGYVGTYARRPETLSYIGISGPEAVREQATLPQQQRQVAAAQPVTLVQRPLEYSENTPYSSFYGGYAGRYEATPVTLVRPGTYVQQAGVQGFLRRPLELPRQAVAHEPQTFLYGFRDSNSYMRYSPGMSVYGGYAGIYERGPDTYVQQPIGQGIVRQETPLPQLRPQAVAHQPATFLYKPQDYSNYMRYSPATAFYGGYAGTYERKQPTSVAVNTEQQPADYVQQAHPSVLSQEARTDVTAYVQSIHPTVQVQVAPTVTPALTSPAVQVQHTPQAVQGKEVSPAIPVHKVSPAVAVEPGSVDGIYGQRPEIRSSGQTHDVHTQPAIQGNIAQVRPGAFVGSVRPSPTQKQAAHSQTTGISPAVYVQPPRGVPQRQFVPAGAVPDAGLRQAQAFLYRYQDYANQIRSQPGTSMYGGSAGTYPRPVDATQPDSFLFQFPDQNKYMRYGPGTMVYGGYAGTYEKPVLPPPVRFDYSQHGPVLTAPTPTSFSPEKPTVTSTFPLSRPEGIVPQQVYTHDVKIPAFTGPDFHQLGETPLAEQQPEQRRPAGWYGGSEPGEDLETIESTGFDKDVPLAPNPSITAPSPAQPKEPAIPVLTRLDIPRIRYSSHRDTPAATPVTQIHAHPSDTSAAHKYSVNHIVVNEPEPIVRARKPDLQDEQPVRHQVPQSILGELSLVLTRMRPTDYRVPVVSPLKDIAEEEEGVAEKLIAPDNGNDLAGTAHQESTLVSVVVQPPFQQLEEFVHSSVLDDDAADESLVAANKTHHSTLKKSDEIKTGKTLIKSPAKSTIPTSSDESDFFKSRSLVRTIEETSTFPPETVKFLAEKASKMRIPKDKAIPEAACTRAGLFRHPHKCGKFYECFFDKWLNKYTVHEFDCPIKLAFDESVSACSSEGFEKLCNSS